MTVGTSAAHAADAPAKVNLFLHAVDRRPDGYHEIDSLVVFAGAADRLTATRADALTLETRGPFGAALAAEPDNLVLRAARALAAAAGARRGARLVLEKHLPVASGIGGGSADAAAALRVLEAVWGVRLAPAARGALALGLGADVPVCLASAAARMGGIGEVVSPAPALPVFGIVLANPGVAVATADVFRARAPVFSPPAVLPPSWDSAGAMAADLRGLRNDLQEAATALCPAIGDVLAALETAPQCLFAGMSGSGATCFAITATPASAETMAAALRAPGWWVWGGAPFAPAVSGP